MPGLQSVTVQDLAKLLAVHIAQGRARHEVALFQWEHGSEPLTDVEPRDAVPVLELYSNTHPAPASASDVDDLL